MPPRKKSAADEPDLTPAQVAVELGRNKEPMQSRGVETRERILDAAARLLGDVGFERLSTNLVCERAGLTPPALYRYYPNKYAILAELGMRLMMSQNELLERWAVPATMKLPAAKFEAALCELFLGTLEITRQATAGEWITRALRAVPALAPVRIGSHDHVTGLVLTAFQGAWPGIDVASARLTARLSVEVMYSAMELLHDDPALDPAEVGRLMSAMVAAQVVRLRKGPATPAP